MDGEATERLKRLQMEDLGTLRREYISTADNKCFRNIRLKDIEVTRKSNVAGTDAERVAKANAPQLNAWANMYKEISDTQELEQLDNLLDGQSHRLQLRAAMQGSGGQSYSRITQKKDDSLKAAEKAPKGRSTSIRSLKTAECGGGVIGTRDRVTKRIASNAQAWDLQQPVVSKLDNHFVELPHSKKRPQDPALDNNNYSSKNGREYYARKIQIDIRGIRRELASLKTRRPILDYSRILSPPESFLTAARSLATVKSASTSSPSVASRSPEEAGATSLSLDASSQNLESIKGLKDNATAQNYEEYSEPLCSEGDPVTIATLASSKHSQSAQVGMDSTPNVANKEDQHFQLTSSKSSQSEQPSTGLTEPKSQDKSPTQSDEPLRQAAQIRGPAPTTQLIKGSIHNSPAEKLGELLLDFDSTPPHKGVLNVEDRGLMSPTMEDLRGIYFQEHLAPIPSQRLETSEPRGIQTETLLSPSEEGSKSDKTSFMQAKIPVDLDNLQKKIVGFYNFVESIFRQHVPGHLQEESLRVLLKYKQELMEQIPWPRQLSRGGPPQIAEQHQNNITSQKASTSTSENQKKLQRSEIFSPIFSASSIAEPLAESTSPEKDHGSLDLPSEGSPSRFNATAMPFFSKYIFNNPERNINFSKYRDSNSASSSDSELPQSPADHLQHTHQHSKNDAIIHSPAPSNPKPIPQPKQHARQSSDSHIFGDHLLPGRRGGQDQTLEKEASSAENPFEHGTSQPRVKFSILNQPQASVYVPKETLSMFDKENDQELPESRPFSIVEYPTTTKDPSIMTMASVHAPRETGSNVSNTYSVSTLSAPGAVTTNIVRNTISKVSELKQSIHAPKPNALQQSRHAPRPNQLQQSIHASKSDLLQQSIHAPKNQENHVSQEPSGPFGGSLGGSIHARRPLR